MLSKPIKWEVVGDGPKLLVHYDNSRVDTFYLTEHGLLGIKALVKCYMPVNRMMTVRQHLDAICNS